MALYFCVVSVLCGFVAVTVFCQLGSGSLCVRLLWRFVNVYVLIQISNSLRLLTPLKYVHRHGTECLEAANNFEIDSEHITQLSRNVRQVPLTFTNGFILPV